MPIDAAGIQSGNTAPGAQPPSVVFVIDRVAHYHLAMLRAVAQGLSARGITFTVLSSQDPEGAVGRTAAGESVDTRHRHFGLTEWRIGRFTLRHQHGLLKLLRELRPGVVVSCCHVGTFSEWWLLGWARRHQLQAIAWQCGYEYNRSWIKSLAWRWMVPIFDFHLCYHSQAQRFAKKYGASADQTVVMHNTINETKICRGSKKLARSRLAERWPGCRDKKIVLFVGAVLQEKCLDRVFAALDRLADPTIHFMLVGDGPYLPVLRARYAARSDWTPAGQVLEDVGLYFDAADLFVLPGTGGLAINEAMAHGLPVVCGQADGSADDLVEAGVNGLRLVDGTAQELAGCFAQVLADPEQAAAMGARGEARIRQRLTFQSFVATVVSALAAASAFAVAADAG